MEIYNFDSIEWRNLTFSAKDEFIATVVSGKKQLMYGDPFVWGNRVFMVTGVNKWEDSTEYTLKYNPRFIVDDSFTVAVLTDGPEYEGEQPVATLECPLPVSVIEKMNTPDIIYVNGSHKYSGAIKIALRRFSEDALDGMYMHFDDLTVKFKL